MKPLQISAETAQTYPACENCRNSEERSIVTLDDGPGFFFMSLFHLEAKENTACITLTLDAPV